MLTFSIVSCDDGGCQLNRIVFARQRAEQLVQTLPSLSRRNKTAPLRDNEIDRRQRPRTENRACDDDAGGRFLIDHELRADREKRRLEQQPQHFRKCTEAAGNVARAFVLGNIIAVCFRPPAPHAAGHAHCNQNPPHCGGSLQRLCCEPSRFRKRPASDAAYKLQSETSG